MKNVRRKQIDEALRRIENITGITKVRLNPIAASITILYDPQINTESAIMSKLTSIIKESFLITTESGKGIK